MEQIKRLNPYLRAKFNKKIYKISLNPGTTCPNRDGTIGTGGCIFCSRGGSGDFASDSRENIAAQIEAGIDRVSKKIHGDAGYIAYFQAFTGTYGKVDYLEPLFMEAAEDDRIAAVSIATRPDCLGDDIMEMLDRINRIKPLMIELGFQTSNSQTTKYIRRGYENTIFDEAVARLRKSGIEVIVHIIIGLPGETKEDMINTVEYINRLDVQGVKLQLLHVLKETDLELEYQMGRFKVLSLEEYGQILVEMVEHLRADIVIHRLTGDGPKSLLIDPMWSADKKKVLNYINTLFNEKNVIQGRRCSSDGDGFIHSV